jgi:hypothetical protein
MSSDRIAQAKAPRPRGWITWTPNTKTRALIDDVKAVFADYEAQLPLTARQIFYVLVGRDRIGKTERDYSRLCEHLQRMRRSRMIPFAYIRDDSVGEKPVSGYRSAGAVRDAIRHTLANAALHPDTGQAVHQIVLTEAAGMLPMIAQAVDAYGVTVLSSGGFDGVTFKHSLAERVTDDRRPAVIHHIGDYDPSGVHIYQSLAEDVVAFCEGHDVTFRRVAVTPGQIDEHALPMKPAKTTDARSFDGFGTVQCEALPPDVLQDLVRDAVGRHWDAETYNDALAVFDAGMDDLRAAN